MSKGRCAESALTREAIDSLERALTQELQAIRNTIESQAASENAREYSTRMDRLVCPQHELAQDVIAAEDSRDQDSHPFIERQLSRHIAREAAKCARKMYDRTKRFVPRFPDTIESQSYPSKLEIIKAMPYIMAMRYACGVEISARVAMSASQAREPGWRRYLERSHRDLNELARILRSAVMGILRNTSLLEIATEYHSPLATYLNLIIALEADARRLDEPRAISAGENEQLWDDGLSNIR